MKAALSAMLAAILVSSCATGYTGSNSGLQLTGGSKAERIAHNTYRVRFNGNGYTKQSSAIEQLTLRAAQTALEQGARYFEVDALIDRSRKVRRMRHEVVGAIVPNAYGTYDPTQQPDMTLGIRSTPYDTGVRKPRFEMVMQTNSIGPADPERGVYDAFAIWQALAPRHIGPDAPVLPAGSPVLSASARNPSATEQLWCMRERPASIPDCRALRVSVGSGRPTNDEERSHCVWANQLAVAVDPSVCDSTILPAGYDADS